jgi:hypothetical protein
VSVGQKLHAPSSEWVQNFIVFQFICQAALLFDFLGQYRILLRSAAFGGSLALLLILPKGRQRPHPATQAAFWVLVILLLSFFHPTTNSVLASVVQVALYLAILGPLFWVPRLKLDVTALRRVLLIIFIFHTISAGVGVLQARYPGSFQPALSTTIAGRERAYLEGLKITLASGQSVFRPMGLTDIPGGAATAGFYTVLLGMGFYLTSRQRWMRLICLVSSTLGLICIYLSQVRSTLIITAVCMIAFCGFLIWQKRTNKLLVLGMVLTAVIALSFVFAVSLGGKGVTGRMSTLVQDRPDAVYYKNRGHYLEETIYILLPQYPLGAGLGRWGMAYAYFGDNSDPERAPIYVEIQWTGWLLDGGVPLILAYVVMLIIGFYVVSKIALSRAGGDLPVWGALVLAYSVGTLATIFTYPLFISQGGMEYWLINATLFAAARTIPAQPRLSKGERG